MKSSLLPTLLSCLIQPGRFLHSARQRQGCGAPEDGLTLLECLVAIAVIALTGAMIGPPLVMAAATRVQNRRAEQALQLAQGEVDRIRAMVIRGTINTIDPDTDNLPRLTENELPALVTVNNLKDHPAPNSLMAGKLKSPECNNYDPDADVPAANQVLAVDVNGKNDADNCEADFLVQSFRQNLDRAGGIRDFQLMVRVYSAKAEDYFGNLKEEQASLGFTSGDGDYWQKPLAVLTTRINQSDTDAALCGYHGLNTEEQEEEDAVDNDC